MIETTLDGKTKDIVQENIEQLKQLFPEIVTEDKIDFDKLREILGEEIDDSNERYNFIWSGKQKAIKTAQTPSDATLRPVIEDSKNWDTTENLYIEGENSEVLKLLQKTYYQKIDAIYIDPPYNTGNNIIYQNDYSENLEEYLKITGQLGTDNIKLSTNSEENGRYHSNWLNMMYPSLRLSRNLLKKDGIIFVAIDDHEYHNLKNIMDEIYGESNYVGTVITKCNPQGRGKKNLDPVHEYHLIYAKNIDYMDELKILRNKDNKQEYQTFLRSGTNSRKWERPNRFYPMLVKDNKVFVITQEEYDKIYVNQSFNEEHISKITEKYEKLGYEVIFPIAKNGEEKVWQRTYERAAKEHNSYIYQKGSIKTPKDNYRTPITLWDDLEYSNVQYGTNELIKLFNNKKTFDFPKSYVTVKDLLSFKKNSLVLDFFSGSGTTAQSVMSLNIERNENCKFILVQIPATTNEEDDAYKNGFYNICEIAKERIRIVGNKITEENPDVNIDVGFKVFKWAKSNLTKWNPDVDDLENSLIAASDNIIEGRSELDLVYEIMLKYGIELTSPVEELSFDKYNFYSVGMGALVICLNDHVTRDIAEDVLKIKEELSPDVIRVVFKDNGFESDADKTNVKEILRNNEVDEFITI